VIDWLPSALVDRAAKIDRIAQDQMVIAVEMPCKNPGQFIAHHADRAIAVRLEKGDNAARKGLQRRQRRCRLVRIMTEIVDYSDATCDADNVEAPGQPRKAFHAMHRLRHRHIKR
jgi:hypothetical protein